MPDRLPCIIPARGGSKGIPRKNLVDLCGKPLIAWTIEAAKAAESIDKVYVSTEDIDIAATAASYGADIIDRPKDLAADHTSSEDVLYHAIAALEAQNGTQPEAFVFMQCTSPLTSPNDIERAVEILNSGDTDSVVSVTSSQLFLWREDAENRAVPINHQIDYRPRRQELQPEFAETGAIYAIRTSAMLQDRRRYCGVIRLMEMPLIRSFEIDTLEELALVETILKEQIASGG